MTIKTEEIILIIETENKYFRNSSCYTLNTNLFKWIRPFFVWILIIKKVNFQFCQHSNEVWQLISFFYVKPYIISVLIIILNNEWNWVIAFCEALNKIHILNKPFYKRTNKNYRKSRFVFLESCGSGVNSFYFCSNHFRPHFPYSLYDIYERKKLNNLYCLQPISANKSNSINIPKNYERKSKKTVFVTSKFSFDSRFLPILVDILHFQHNLI